MFGLGKPSAKGLIGKLRGRGLTLDQIAALLPPDAQGRPVSRVTLSKVLGGEYSGAQLVERLRALVDGKEQPSRPARHTPRSHPTPRSRRGEARQPGKAHNLRRVGLTPAPATTPPHRSPATAIPLLEDVAPTEIGAPIRFGGDLIGYVGPNGAIVRERPVQPARSSDTSAAFSREDSEHARLNKLYSALRGAGLSDTEAQALLIPQRSEQRRQTQADKREQELQALTMQLLPQAEHELRTGNNAGIWTTADVVARARQMAEDALRDRQPLRQADQTPKLLPTLGYRAPGQERGQQAGPITFGRVKPPIGSEHTPLSPERATEVRRQLRAVLAGRR